VKATKSIDGAKGLKLLTLSILAWTGCAEPKPDTSAGADAAARRAAYDSANDAFHAGLRANDTALFVYVAEDVLVMPPGEAPLRGKTAMREWYNALLLHYRTSSLTFSDREVFVGDEWAGELGSYEWNLTPVAGGAAVVDRGNYMQLWHRQPDGQWRFAREIWNSSAPAVPPQQ